MLPIYIKINDFLSHNESKIDFQKFNIALILGSYYGEFDQSNGSGKTGIFAAIRWALFDKSRHKKKDGVVKQDKRKCCVEYTFDVDGSVYKIVRTRDKIIGESDVVLYQIIGGTKQNISCDTNTATNNKIIKIIGVDDGIFTNSVYFRQNDISMFASTSAHKRKDILKSFLKMDKWADYHKKASMSAKQIENTIEEKSKNCILVKDIESDLIKCKKDINNLKKEIREGEEKYILLHDQVILSKSQYQTLYNTSDISKDALKKLYIQFKSAKNKINQDNNSIRTNNKIINNNVLAISSLNKKNKMLANNIKRAGCINIDKLNKNLLIGESKKTVLKNQINKLRAGVNLSKNCELCKTPLTKAQVAKIKQRLSQELKEYTESYKHISEKLKAATIAFNKKAKLVSAANKAKLDKSKLDVRVLKLQNENNQHTAENQQLISDIEQIQSRDLQQEIKTLKLRLDHHAKENFKNKINKLESELHLVKKSHDRLNVEYGSKITRKKELETSFKEQIKNNTEISKLKENFLIYNKLKTCFGKDGVQAIIIENVIEELEIYTNDILNKICNEPTSIMFKTQKQSDNGRWVETLDIIVKSGTRADDFETFSGGEQFRISLALRLALSNILSKRMGGSLKLLLLDEVSSNLDNKGLEMFMSAIKKIGKSAKILVITHNERLKEQFDDIIMVNKDSNGSSAHLQ